MHYTGADFMRKTTLYGCGVSIEYFSNISGIGWLLALNRQMWMCLNCEMVEEAAVDVDQALTVQQIGRIYHEAATNLM